MSEQKFHMLKSLRENVRYDGRSLLDFRKLEFETGVSGSAEGSARVKLGDTEVLCGIKLELGKPYPDTPDQGSLMVGAELLPMSNPEFESGPPDIKSIELARVVDRGIRESHALDVHKLCITPGEKSWTVIIDVVTINDAGNLLDAAGIAAMLALEDARFPELENGVVNYKKKTDKKLPVEKFPLPVTVIKIGDSFIVDPLIEEEKEIDARLTVASIADGTICAMQKGGATALSIEEIEKMVEIAIAKAKEIRKQLKR